MLVTVFLFAFPIGFGLAHWNMFGSEGRLLILADVVLFVLFIWLRILNRTWRMKRRG